MKFCWRRRGPPPETSREFQINGSAADATEDGGRTRGSQAKRLSRSISHSLKRAARSVRLSSATSSPEFKVYCSNEVITSKYTIYNFLFKNLYEQFHKLSNVYFLIIAILQCIPQVSTTNGFPTLAFPLVLVLAANGAKDAYEDWRRHLSDNQENRQPTHRLVPGWRVRLDCESGTMGGDDGRSGPGDKSQMAVISRKSSIAVLDAGEDDFERKKDAGGGVSPSEVGGDISEARSVDGARQSVLGDRADFAGDDAAAKETASRRDEENRGIGLGGISSDPARSTSSSSSSSSSSLSPRAAKEGRGTSESAGNLSSRRKIGEGDALEDFFNGNVAPAVDKVDLESVDALNDKVDGGPCPSNRASQEKLSPSPRVDSQTSLQSSPSRLPNIILHRRRGSNRSSIENSSENVTENIKPRLSNGRIAGTDTKIILRKKRSSISPDPYHGTSCDDREWSRYRDFDQGNRHHGGHDDGSYRRRDDGSGGHCESVDCGRFERHCSKADGDSVQDSCSEGHQRSSSDDSTADCDGGARKRFGVGDGTESPSSEDSPAVDRFRSYNFEGATGKCVPLSLEGNSGGDDSSGGDDDSSGDDDSAGDEGCGGNDGTVDVDFLKAYLEGGHSPHATGWDARDIRVSKHDLEIGAERVKGFREDAIHRMDLARNDSIGGNSNDERGNIHGGAFLGDISRAFGSGEIDMTAERTNREGADEKEAASDPPRDAALHKLHQDVAPHDPHVDEPHGEQQDQFRHLQMYGAGVDDFPSDIFGSIPEDELRDSVVDEGDLSSIDTLEYIGMPPIRWKDVTVGDLLVIRNREVFPADLVLLASSDQHGIAFVETSSLDGETNLKVRQVNRELLRLIGYDDLVAFERCARVNGNMKCSPPDKDLGFFEGVVELSLPVDDYLDGAGGDFGGANAQAGADNARGADGQLSGDKAAADDSHNDNEPTEKPSEKATEGKRMSRMKLGKIGKKKKKRTEKQEKGTAETKVDPQKLISTPPISLTPDHLLLRGCRLRNTDWIVGLVVYTGHETKIQKNSAPSGRKSSRVEHMTNKLTMLIWFVQICACISAAIASSRINSSQSIQERSYLGISTADNAFVHGLIQFLSWMVLTCNLVPISLVVQMGLVKAFQAYFITYDDDMFVEATNTRATPRTSDLNEELGEVKYVFSDKTGTLTCNLMEFRKCCVNGITYGEGLTEIRRQVLKKTGKPVPPEPQPDPNEAVTPNVNFVDKYIRRHLNDSTHVNHQPLVDFFVHLAVNHSVVPEIESNGSIRYSASSPDDGALVYGARHFGIEFQGRNPTGVVLNVFGTRQHVDILATVDFTSTRKRSSVLCRIKAPPSSSTSSSPTGGRLVLFCKGADTVISPLLVNNGALEKRIFESMEDYALDGLRTLCIAKRDLSEKEFEEWYQEYQEACVSLVDRQAKIDRAVEKLERNLTLQGATGIEDRLQDDVGLTIESLRKAGINVWMLTGDKTETAINIAVATGMITVEMTVTQFVWEQLNCNSGDLGILLDKTLAEARAGGEKRRGEVESKSRAIVVDGTCLQHLLQEDFKSKFASLCSFCETVVCCRVTPHQKGEVVLMIKKLEKKVTLAIGDGANDCNMIQCAHVGVGLRGQEGMQAFNSSDYGLSQFRSLRNLLLVHGRWNHRRITKLVVYMFYKNLVLVMPMFYYGALSLFSGQKFYFEFLYQMYNVVLTALPITILGTFDQDVDKKTSLRYPQLYTLGHSRYYFNFLLFLSWILNGMYHGFISMDLWTVGLSVFIINMVVVNIKVLLESYYCTWFVMLGVLISLLCCLISVLAFSTWPGVGNSILGAFYFLAETPIFWFCLICSVTLCLFRDWFWKTLRRTMFPELYHIIQEMGDDFGKVSKSKRRRARLDSETIGQFETSLPQEKGISVQLDQFHDERDALGDNRAISVRFSISAIDGESALPRRSPQSMPSSSIEERERIQAEELVQRRESLSRSITNHRGYAFSEADPITNKMLRTESFNLNPGMEHRRLSVQPDRVSIGEAAPTIFDD